jgi:hypothetical protein
MGIGGALIMPSTLSIITDMFRDTGEAQRAIAVWAGASGVGIAPGPPGPRMKVGTGGAP